MWFSKGIKFKITSVVVKGIFQKVCFNISKKIYVLLETGKQRIIVIEFFDYCRKLRSCCCGFESLIFEIINYCDRQKALMIEIFLDMSYVNDHKLPRMKACNGWSL